MRRARATPGDTPRCDALRIGAPLMAVALLGFGCATASPPSPTSAPQSAAPRVAPAPSAGAQDTTGQGMVPAGYGTMHQDDLSLHIEAPGLLIRALPLDEGIIRLLTPDSYRSVRDLLQSSRKAIDTAMHRRGKESVSVWLVSFYGVQPDVQFTPLDVYLSSSGRDFQPYDVLPLTAGFSEQRIRQRETQSALYLFDGDVQLNQPVIVTYEGVRDDSWEQALQQIERERALILARARKTH